MALAVTLATLVSRATKRADKVGDGSIDGPEWKELVGESYREAYEIAAAICRHFEAEDTITANGSTSYAEPTAGVLQMIGIDFIIDASGQRAPLEELMAQERGRYAGLTGAACAYTHIAGQITLLPKPTSGTYKVLFNPPAPDLSIGADSLSVDVMCSAGERFTLWGAALNANQKSKGDWDEIRAQRELDRAREDLQVWAANEAKNNPRRMVAYEDFRSRRMPGDWRWR